MIKQLIICGTDSSSPPNKMRRMQYMYVTISLITIRLIKHCPSQKKLQTYDGSYQLHHYFPPVNRWSSSGATNKFRVAEDAPRLVGSNEESVNFDAETLLQSNILVMSPDPITVYGTPHKLPDLQQVALLTSLILSLSFGIFPLSIGITYARKHGSLQTTEWRDERRRWTTWSYMWDLK